MLRVNNLTGFGGGGRVTTLAFVDSATSVAETITIPAGARAGDLGVLADYSSDGGSTPTDVTPSGWTGWAMDGGGGAGSFGRGRLSYKILTASDPSASVTGMASTPNKVMFVFRGDRPITTVTPSTAEAEWTGGNPVSQSAAASGATAPVLVIGCAASNAATAAFSTASPAFDDTVLNADSDIIAGYTIYNSAPSDHTIDMNDLGDDNFLASGYLRVS